jgi:hypothetical protein
MRTFGVSGSVGLAGLVVFSQSGPGDGEECVGEHADAHVPMPGGPVADLVLVEAEQVFAGLVVVFDVPPPSGRADHRQDAGTGTGVDQEVLNLVDAVGVFGVDFRRSRPADQQGVLMPFGCRLVFDRDAVRGPVIEPLAFAAITGRTPLPYGVRCVG